MPRYTYECSECFETFDVVHGMNDERFTCDFCNSASIRKVPQMLSKAPQTSSKGSKAGDKVKRAIEENRAILKEERKIRVEIPDGD
jgi:putative FmdB family regulatory protein